MLCKIQGDSPFKMTIECCSCLLRGPCVNQLSVSWDYSFLFVLQSQLFRNLVQIQENMKFC